MSNGSSRSAVVPAEKVQRALQCQLGACLVVAGALVAVEAVAGIVEMDRNLRIARADLVDVGQRDALILLAEMQQGRNLGRAIEELADLSAVIADRCREAGHLGRGQ